MTRSLTSDEQVAIRALRKLEKRWPKTLRLFVCSIPGTLQVLDAEAYAKGGKIGVTGFIDNVPGATLHAEHERMVLAEFRGIPCDAGEP